MVIKTVQWNIGGGKIRRPDSDPMDPLSYCVDALDSIADTLSSLGPDIITIQEAHSGRERKQIEYLAHQLGIRNFVEDIYDSSHLEEGQDLSQGIISRFPIRAHSFQLFYNPKLETIGPKGERWTSHDKGVSGCMIAAGEGELNLKTSHSFPARRYKVDPLGEEIGELRKDMAVKLKPEADRYLYQGDLNYNEWSVKPFLPDLFESGVTEVVLDQPTTPKGRKYDRIIFRNLEHLASVVIKNVLTDHFPIYSEFEIN